MRLLLDTHAYLWWIAGSDRLSAAANDAVTNSGNEVFFSAASAWEIATKHRLGRLPEAQPVIQNILTSIESVGFEELPISVRGGELAGSLPNYHQDPFDCIIIAQALIRNLAIVSNERIFDRYGINRIW